MMTDDAAARARAVDPRFNVVLEASAGTGKTRVLVDRYVNLLRAGVDPRNILAMTFTRKAAAEMRERIMATLQGAAARGELPPARWRELRSRTADIAISTIDAFCLSLLREFPLEADLDPAFSVADETELPRLMDQALDRALRRCRAAARDDEHVALAFAHLGERRTRAGLSALLRRRLVAPGVLARLLSASGAERLTVEDTTRRAAASMLDVFQGMRDGFEGFVDSGPLESGFLLLTRRLERLRAALAAGGTPDPAAVQAVYAQVRDHFLTQDGEPRVRAPYPRAAFHRDDNWRRHRDLVARHAAEVLRISKAYRRDLNVLTSRGVWRMYRIAESEYRHTLDSHALLDFPDLLQRALELLRRMDEFSQSRYRLESRYHHVLVDEFQDTSRAQWDLVSLIVEAWGHGAGLAHTGALPPSIFIVGDRKQAIYGFRDADASVMRDAARHIQGLRSDGDVRRTISRSFRAVAPLLAFVNDLCQDVEKAVDRADGFEYGDGDRFPVPGGVPDPAMVPLGMITGDSPEECAETTAAEVARLLDTAAPVRDRDTGVCRAIRPGDIAILFRTRESHREFESALEGRGIPAYVYKGLGFFDADEIKDVRSLVWYLADPASDLRAASFLRSRLIGLSDEALRQLAPHLAVALRGTARPDAWGRLSARDAEALEAGRAACRRWGALVDRLPPAELVDLVLSESAYVCELRGVRYAQARENLKKLRALLRRIQNRGYRTMARMAAHLDQLAVGEESNAAIDAVDAVSLMTVHAAKGLEFPVVFVVNLTRGTGGRRDPVRVAADFSGRGESVAVGDFESEADEDAAARAREETKRLLYVAVTRARDRLYLAAVRKDGAIVPARGSLAEVLPLPLVERLGARSPATIDWRASSGATHRFAVCKDVDADQSARRVSSVEPSPAAPPRDPDDFAPLVLLSSASGTTPEGTVPMGSPAAGRLDIACPFDLRALSEAGECWYRVPFMLRTADGPVRGTIDCLVRLARNHVAVIAVRTARPVEADRAQLDVWRAVAERLFPGATVDAHLAGVVGEARV